MTDLCRVFVQTLFRCMLWRRLCVTISTPLNSGCAHGIFLLLALIKHGTNMTNVDRAYQLCPPSACCLVSAIAKSVTQHASYRRCDMNSDTASGKLKSTGVMFVWIVLLEVHQTPWQKTNACHADVENTPFTGSSLLLLPFFGYGWAVLAKVEIMSTPVCSLSVLAAAAAAAISCNPLSLPALSSPSSESPVQRALWLVCPEAQDLVRGAEAAPDVPAAFKCSWLLLLPLPQLPPLQLPRRWLYAAASCDCYLQRSACVSLLHH
jgi:hypothetical protein